MSKEMREQIDKVKNFGQFLNENVSINFTENQKKLREYTYFNFLMF